MSWKERDLEGLSQHEQWRAIENELEHLLAADEPWYTTLSNAAALLFFSIPQINWAGFYIVHEDHLALGPFGGKPACTRIEFGRGVCGTAAIERATLLVPDVEQFPGHITCDLASRSEIVIPLLTDAGTLLGVLDIDSPQLARFDATDQRALESIARAIVRKLPRVNGNGLAN